MTTLDRPDIVSKTELTYSIQDTDLIDLWKYFEDQGNTVKTRMLTIVTWVLAFATGLLGFTVQELGVLEGTADRAWMAAVLSFIGLLICVYACFLVAEFGKHMQRHWNAADALLERIEGLESIRQAGQAQTTARDEMTDDDDDGEWVPRICQNILIVVAALAILFFMVFRLSINSACVFPEYQLLKSRVSAFQTN